MKLSSLFQGNTLRDFLKSFLTASGILAAIAVIYFYIYLPTSTNFNESVIVPDFLGLPSERIDSAVAASGLRYEISDSSYSEDFGPLEIIRQFPKPGSMVKPDRKIFISINRIDPPTVPVPAIVDLSLLNAEATLTSIGLRRGQIIYQPGPFADLVIGMTLGTRAIGAGYRVPKGTVINLIVGDGAGPKDFIINDLVGMSLSNAMLIISNSNLHLGDVRVGPDADTTGVESFVYRQLPPAGDSVRLGEPVHLGIAPKDYIPDPVESDEPEK